MRILNLYAGLGGNRQLIEGHDIVAVEFDPKIAALYAKQFPNDEIVVGDAHDYLLNNFQDFDIIWSSPPCQSHSKMIRSGKNRKARFTDLKLYEEILFLSHNFKGRWVVENVRPFYEPLIEPSAVIGRHVIWSSEEKEAFCGVSEHKTPSDFINLTTIAGMRKLQDWLNIHYEKPIYYGDNHCPAQILRNCVHPIMGKAIFDAIVNNKKEA